MQALVPLDDPDKNVGRNTQPFSLMSTLEANWGALDTPTDWYRLPSVKVALVLSLLLHAAAIVLLPSLRVPEPTLPPPLTVELAPPPVPEPAPKVETPPPPAPTPVIKHKPLPRTEAPPPPPPVVQPEPKPEPPPVEQKVAPPPPQPVAVPPQAPVAEPRVTAPPKVETPPPAPRVEAPPPAPPAPAPVVAPAIDGKVLHDYGALVSGAVAKKKVYPRLALMRRWQGTAVLKLQVAPDGSLRSVNLLQSSGFDVLDEQAVKMVKDAMPLPNLPDALRGRDFAIDIPVAFKLQD
jgi:protein TonB